MQPTSGAFFAIASLTLAGLLAGPALAQEASSGCISGGHDVDPNAPCLAQVDDILDGSHKLFPNQDLMLVGWRGATSYVNLPLCTNDLEPTLEHDQTGTDCAPPSDDPLPFSTRLGRVYAIDHDVIVSATWAKNLIGIGCTQQFYVVDRDPATQTDTVVDTVGWSDAHEPRLALFDADRDGFDNIFTMNAEGVQFHSPLNALDLRSNPVFRSRLQFGSGIRAENSAPVTLVPTHGIVAPADAVATEARSAHPNSGRV